MKLKLNTLTKGLSFVGIVIILFSMGWHIKYPDNSQLVLFIIQGIFFLGFAYMCEFTRRIQEKYNELDNIINRLDRWAKQRFEKLEGDLK